MNITTKRIVFVGDFSHSELLRRLDSWADRYGFEPMPDDGQDFMYRRGSQWHALYTFDIRKIPTKVRIRPLPDDDGTCYCTMTCRSWLQCGTAGDEKRLSCEMDLLEACLRGLLTDARLSAPHNTNWSVNDDLSADEIQAIKDRSR